jgi:hypothetical protein
MVGSSRLRNQIFLQDLFTNMLLAVLIVTLILLRQLGQPIEKKRPQEDCRPSSSSARLMTVLRDRSSLRQISEITPLQPYPDKIHLQKGLRTYIVLQGGCEICRFECDKPDEERPSMTFQPGACPSIPGQCKRAPAPRL